jgi:hypothetical protein
MNMFGTCTTGEKKHMEIHGQKEARDKELFSSIHNPIISNLMTASYG